jgi:hypothetical protein
MVLSLSGTGEGSLKIALDGQNRLDVPVTLLGFNEGAIAGVGVAHYSASFPAHEVRIDDVVIDVSQ